MLVDYCIDNIDCIVLLHDYYCIVLLYDYHRGVAGVCVPLVMLELTQTKKCDIHV